MANILELSGFVEEGGRKQPFYLCISMPVKSTDADDFYCCVHAPILFKEDKKIFGVDEAQAKELAIEFVRSLLKGKRLTDEKGNLIAGL